MNDVRQRFSSVHALPLILLVVSASWIFREHLFGAAVYIGDADRLNSHLNVLTPWVQFLSRRGFASWDERMFMGSSLYGLAYTFPNPLAFLSALGDPTRLMTTAGYASLALLIAATWAAYAFIFDVCRQPWPAFIGAALYQCSSLSILKISQNDMSFAALLHAPILLLLMRRIVPERSGRIGVVLLTAALTSLLYFTFLQKAVYLLLLVGAYAVYCSWRVMSWRPVLALAIAFPAALVISAPRLLTVAEDFVQLTRFDETTPDRRFDDVYRFQNIRPRELFRWFDDGIFGRNPGEARKLGNNINLHEGLLLYTAQATPFLILGSLFRRRWWERRSRGRHGMEQDMRFLIGVVVVVFGVVLLRPVAHLVFLLFLKVDFTHARIVVAGLLPMCTLAACVIARAPAASSNRFRRVALLLTIAAVVGVATAWTVDRLGRRADGSAFRVNVPLKYSISSVADAAIYGGGRGWLRSRLPDIENEPPAEPTLFHAGGAARIVWSGTFVALLTFCARLWRRRPSVAWVLVHAVGFMAVTQGLAYANAQINGSHVKTAIPFENNNFLSARPGEFLLPSIQQAVAVRRQLENDAYRAVLVCDPAKFPAFCAPHISRFWGLRVVEGYSSGIPSRLASLPWPDGVRSLRALSFPSLNSLPWPLLRLLNVKYAIVVDGDFYRNRRTDAGEAPAPVVIHGQEPDRPVTPRAFFTRSVTSVASPSEAVDRLFSSTPQGVRDVVAESVVENYSGRSEFGTEGTLQAQFDREHIDIEMSPSGAPRFLVINELFHPRWRAYSSLGALPIYPTNAVMRGMVVPPNTDRITLEFVPAYRFGTALPALLAGMAMLAAAIYPAAWNARPVTMSPTQEVQ